jgi:hypothetical protein
VARIEKPSSMLPFAAMCANDGFPSFSDFKAVDHAKLWALKDPPRIKKASDATFAPMRGRLALEK